MPAPRFTGPRWAGAIAATRAEGRCTASCPTAGRRSRIRGSMAKVLIVDDSDTIRSFLALSVKAMKLEPVLADCGEAALALFAAERPDLVLLDVNMPGIDG